MSYGKLTVPKEEGGTRDIEISDFMNSIFADGRKITIAGLEDGSFLINLTNPEENERNTQNQLWLSKESFFALHTLSTAYCGAKGLDAIVESLESGGLECSHSPNLSEKIKDWS
jgi:hypothetical protein